MSNICSFSMENTHNNVEFGVLQKTSKQSLILIFFQIGRGDTPLPYPPPARHFVPRSRASPLFTQTRPPHPEFPRSAPGVAPPPGLLNIKDFIHPLLIYFNTAHPTVMISVINLRNNLQFKYAFPSMISMLI